jgi:hypothetical protein
MMFAVTAREADDRRRFCVQGRCNSAGGETGTDMSVFVFLQKENVYSVLMFSNQNIVITSYSLHTSPPHLMVICCNDNRRKL